MSILAEPHRKQKWSLNPRGKQWSEDSNKFGQRMLEKMGWSRGKGLGINEQGITENVHVCFKNDTTGIGFKKDDLDKAWTEHQESFNDILQKLQESQQHNVIQTEQIKTELSEKSLELKSKQSRARVHYQKFTRGKDIHKYSSKDIANIFGQKEMNLDRSGKNKQGKAESSDSIGIQDNRAGVITIHSGNMVNYFMKKNQDFSLKPKSKTREETNLEDESNYIGFGFISKFNKVQFRDGEDKEIKRVCNYAFESPCVQLNNPKNISDSTNENRLFKKRKFGDNNLSLNNHVKKFKNDNINAASNLGYQTDDTCNGKEFEISRIKSGLINTALDLSDEATNKKKVTFSDHVTCSGDTIKKKESRVTLDKFEVENKKTKKMKKQSIANNSILSGFVNEALDIKEMPEEIHDNEISECKNRKSIKKENHRFNLEIITEIPEENKEVCKDKMEIKGIEAKEYINDNLMFQENACHKKREKKKRKGKVKDITIETRKNTEEIVEKNITTEVNKKFEGKECKLYQKDQENVSKSKKKKKKKHIEPDGDKHENTISESKKKNSNIEDKYKNKAEVVKVKKEKKNKIDVNTDDFNTNIVNIKEEKVFDKENISNIHENTSDVNKPEKKKHKKSINKYIINNNLICNTEFVGGKHVKQTNTVMTNKPSEITNNETPTLSSPWSEKARISKKLLKSLFHRNSVVQFPGSNIHEIKGYGTDIR